jgi:hypothetical protein
MYLLHHYRSSEDEVENGKDERDLGNYPIPVHLWSVCRTRMCDVEYVLNGQGIPAKCTAIKRMKIGAKSGRNERGYGLEKLWIGTSEGKDTRTIQYPVASR